MYLLPGGGLSVPSGRTGVLLSNTRHCCGALRVSVGSPGRMLICAGSDPFARSAVQCLRELHTLHQDLGWHAVHAMRASHGMQCTHCMRFPRNVTSQPPAPPPRRR